MDYEARLGELDVHSTPPAEQNVKLNSTLPEVPLRVSLRIGKLGDRVMFVVFFILEPHSLAALDIVSNSDGGPGEAGMQRRTMQRQQHRRRAGGLGSGIISL